MIKLKWTRPIAVAPSETSITMLGATIGGSRYTKWVIGQSRNHVAATEIAECARVRQHLVSRLEA